MARDWRGARAFALAHIQRRSEAMEQRLTGMRDVMWEMIESISRSVTTETEADERLTGCVLRLRTALDAPTDELKQQAFGAIDELAALLEERETRQRQLAGTLGGRISELSVELAEARREAERDPLTELANRAVFDRELERAAHLTTLTHECGILLMIDIDGFKEVNDSYGHQAGDAVLKAVARTIVLTFPRRTDVVARYGGDEFAVILTNTHASEAVQLAERLLGNLRMVTVDINGAEVAVTASVGIAELQPRIPAADVMARADEALYRAKHDGRDRIAT
jgi:diguanylate cyclase (GGDEF)-like protein